MSEELRVLRDRVSALEQELADTETQIERARREIAQAEQREVETGPSAEQRRNGKRRQIDAIFAATSLRDRMAWESAGLRARGIAGDDPELLRRVEWRSSHTGLGTLRLVCLVLLLITLAIGGYQLWANATIRLNP